MTSTPFLDRPDEIQGIVELLLAALQRRDPDTLRHARGVAALSRMIGESMGLEGEELERLRVAGLVHDVGKVGVSEEILNRAGRLDRADFEKAQAHSRIGYELLQDHPLLAAVAEVVLHHHEHFDGRGYPDELAGDQIPLASRIICVADTFSAMTSDRPYRPRQTPQVAVEEINRLRGAQFCPEVVAHFNKVCDQLVGEACQDGEAERRRSILEGGLDGGEPVTDSKVLTQVGSGQQVVVERIGGDPEYRRRLLELGLVPGVALRVIRVAPLGDPVEVELRGASFSLRKGEASLVRVAPLEGEASERASLIPERLTSAPSSRRFHIAVAGNPNTGKTTLFNALTGARGRVGNYPGITVDRLVGELELSSTMTAALVDVPGTYSLNAASRDEQVAINEILGWEGSPAPDLVVVVLNATSLDRSLYLLLQVQELGYPVVAAVNMMDEAWAKRMRIDLEGLGVDLGCPVVGVTARTGEGLDELRRTIRDLLDGALPPGATGWKWSPSDDLLAHLDRIVPSVGDLLGPSAVQSRRRAFALWCLMSLSEGDDLRGIPGELRRRTLEEREAMLGHGHDLDLEVTQARYRAIDEMARRRVERGARDTSDDLTRRIDGVLTHPFYGLVVFLVTMGVIFTAIFDWAAPMMDGIESAIGAVGAGVRGLLPGGLLADLVVDGVIAGVGSVLVFLPQILILFFFITLLETSGYLSRAAFMVDRLMQRLGLNGKAFVPLLSGFACAVPAVMATRTLESRRDRLLTMMVIPLMSCSARLPVYTLIIAALFPADERILGPISLGMAMMFGLYLVGTVFALASAGFIGRVVLKGKPQPLILELPPYRLPSLKTVARALWDRAKAFLKMAGTVILIASILLWVMLTFPRIEQPSQDFQGAIAAAEAEGDGDRAERLRNQRHAEEVQNSFAGRLGRVLEPLIEPLGFDWKIGIGLLGSFAAREVFVSTMGQVYAVGETDEGSVTLRRALREQRRADGSLVYTPLTGLSLLIFFMLALQCVSTIAAVRQESGSWKWAGFQLAYMTALAYAASLIVYQGGRLLGFE